MYPIKFKPILKKKVWGGNRLDSILDVESTDKCKYGEAWVVCAHDNGMATVSNGSLSGKTLEEVLVEYGSAILGDNNYGEGFGLFPLLIKFLDIKDKLSVQVHPSAEYASNNNMVSGKFESWYILDASDDAAIILGKNNQITDEDFGIKIRNKNISNLFNIVDVKKGDFIDINPGLLHGTIKGEILLCEIQQNSDITYRLYDFDRLYEGKKRDLHLSHLGAVDSSIIPYISSENNRLVEKVDNVSLERLTSNSHYSVKFDPC